MGEGGTSPQTTRHAAVIDDVIVGDSAAIRSILKTVGNK